MGALVRLVADYGSRVAIALLVFGVLYVAFRYVTRANNRVSSDSENQSENKNRKGPVEPEVCSMCSGPLDDDLKCQYCGTRHR